MSLTLILNSLTDPRYLNLFHCAICWESVRALFVIWMNSWLVIIRNLEGIFPNQLININICCESPDPSLGWPAIFHLRAFRLKTLEKPFSTYISFFLWPFFFNFFLSSIFLCNEKPNCIDPRYLIYLNVVLCRFQFWPVRLHFTALWSVEAYH